MRNRLQNKINILNPKEEKLEMLPTPSTSPMFEVLGNRQNLMIRKSP
jgi:hypothetical protein